MPQSSQSGCKSNAAPAIVGSGIDVSNLNAIPESPLMASESTPPSPVPKTNAITSREDSGIEGYGMTLEDGALAKREIYFCGTFSCFVIYNYSIATCIVHSIHSMNRHQFFRSLFVMYRNH